MVSIFKTLGEAITKKPWAFIALWLVILVISLPLVGVFTANIQYDTQKFIPKDLGAFVAKDKYDEQFPGEYKNQVLVVVESDNKTTAMRFIDDLDERVTNDTTIANLTGTSSIYSIQRDMVVNMTPELYRNLYDAYDNASDGNRELYNATDTILNSSHNLYYLWDNVTEANSEMMEARKQIRDASNQLYQGRDQVAMASSGLYQIQDASDMVYGIPAAYAQAFSTAFNGTNIDDASTAGYNAAMANVVGLAMQAQGLTSDQDRARLTAKIGRAHV